MYIHYMCIVLFCFVLFEQQPNIDPTKIIQLIESNPGIFSMRDSQTLVINADLEQTENRFAMIRNLKQELSDQS